MPPRPPKFRVQLPAFPLPLAVGTDICSISRIRALLVKPTKGLNFVRRILSPHEPRPSVVDLDHSRPTPPQIRNADAALSRAAAFLAGRFAAKEAVFKAHPGRPLGFQDVLILPCRQGDGAVQVEVWQKPRVTGGYDKGPWENGRTVSATAVPPPAKQSLKPYGRKGGERPLSVLELERRENAERDGQRVETSGGGLSGVGGSAQAPNDDELDFLHTSAGRPMQDWIGYLDQPAVAEEDRGTPASGGSGPAAEPIAARETRADSNPDSEPNPAPGVIEEVLDAEQKDYISSPPVAVIHGSSVAQVSISHDGEYAIATCLAYSSGVPPWPEVSRAGLRTLGDTETVPAEGEVAPGRAASSGTAPSASAMRTIKQALLSEDVEVPPKLAGEPSPAKPSAESERHPKAVLARAVTALHRGERILQGGKVMARQACLRLSDPSGPPVRFLRDRDSGPSSSPYSSVLSATSLKGRQRQRRVLQRGNRIAQSARISGTTLLRRGISILNDGSEVVREIKKRRGIPLLSSKYVKVSVGSYVRRGQAT